MDGCSRIRQDIATGPQIVLAAALIIFCVFAALPVQAGINSWTSLGPDGGYISKIVYHRNSASIVYAQTQAGFYRSTDAGAHWTQSGIEAQYCRDFAVDASNPNRVYLVTNQLPARVFLSNDAGATFSTLYTFDQSIGTPTQIVVSADGRSLYTFHYSNTVFRSTDAGQSWQQRSSLPASFPRAAYLDQSDAATVYLRYSATSSIMLAVTHDGANSWQTITLPPAATLMDDFAIDPADPAHLFAATNAGLFTSTDRGATWVSLTSAWTVAVAIDPNSPSVVYRSAFGGEIFKRVANTWSDVSGNLGSFYINTIAVSPHDSSRIMVGNVTGLFVSTGIGTWSRSDAGLVASSVLRFAGSAARNKTYMTGNVFSELADGSDTIRSFDMNAFYALGLKAGNIDVLTPISESGGGLLAGESNTIARTIDGGLTWNRVNYPFAADEYVVDIAATTTFPSIYYVSSNLTLRKSVDFGASWTQIASGLPAGYAAGRVTIAPSDSSILYATPRIISAPVGQDYHPGAGIYKSLDGGSHWTSANTSTSMENVLVYTIAIDPRNPAIVYAATDTALIKTADGGASWTTLAGEQYAAVAIDPNSPNTVYAYETFPDAIIKRSTDAGASWEKLLTIFSTPPSGLLLQANWSPTALIADSGRRDTLRVATSNAGVKQITLAPDVSIEGGREGQIALGAPVTYNYTVKNNGPFKATGIATAVQLPATAASITASAGRGVCAVAASAVTCSTDSLDNAESINVAITATLPAAGSFQVTASVHADQLDPNTGNNSISNSNTTAERTDLGASISGPGTSSTGTAIQYVASISNAGPSPASAVHATYNLASGLTLNSFTVSVGSCAATSTGLSCDLGPLQTGKSVSLTLNVTAATAGTYASTVTVSGNGSDSVNTNDSATISTVVAAPPPPVDTGTSNSNSSSGSAASSSNSGSSNGGGGVLSTYLSLALLGLLRLRRRPSLLGQVYL